MRDSETAKPATEETVNGLQIEQLGRRLTDRPSANSPRFQHLSAHLYGLGPRAVFELLREVAAGANVANRLERYGRLDPEIVRAIGADVMPPICVVLIDGGRR